MDKQIAPRPNEPAPIRTRLPNRRPAVTETLEVGGQTFVATIGFAPEDGQPQETVGLAQRFCYVSLTTICTEEGH